MKYFFQLLIVLFLVSCSNREGKIIDRIKQLESNKSLDKSDTLINSYLEFVNTYPNHKNSPTYLFKAAEGKMRSKKELDATKLYERVANDYPEFDKSPNALINAGVAYESLNDAANARRLFEKFMKVYPKHERYNDVKLMSENVGLSEEELMKRFMQRLGHDSTNINMGND
jgi:tetratricopeptide (TPR) repeat protein